MYSDWKQTRLGDICLKVITGGTPRTREANFYRGGNIPWLKTKEVNYNRIYSTESFITQEGLDNSAAKVIPENSVIIAMYGQGDTAGRVAINKVPLATNQACCNLIINSELADYEYIYYCLKLNYRELVSLKTGSAQPNLNSQLIKNYKLLLPPINRQRHISKILSCLDDKIELNNKINANLEAQAQAIFKSWFVDFEPFKDGEFVDSELGPIPKGWRIGRLCDIIQNVKETVVPGSIKTLPYVPLDALPMHSLCVSDFRPNSEAKSSLIQFFRNDILMGAMRVHFHRVCLAPFDGITRSTCFVLRPKSHQLLLYSLLTCNQSDTVDYASSTSKGSTMPYAVWDSGLGKMAILIPPIHILEEFNKITQPIIQYIRDSGFERRNLAAIRDILLPKLMSGEIEVPTAKSIIKERI